MYYGLNALSNNLIMVDRKKLKNPNGLILGTPGSGKSFSAKREITNAFLVTDDDTLQEAAVLLDLTYNEVRRLIQTGEIEAKKYGLKYLIPRDDIKWFLFQQKLEREN